MHTIIQPEHRKTQFSSSKLLKLFLITLFVLDCAISGLAQGVLVTWNANSESDMAGYILYYGTQSRVYNYSVNVGLSTEFAIETLPDTGTFYFAVTAYDHAGNESRYSAEASTDITDNSPPEHPFSLGTNYPNPFNPVTTIPFSLPKRLVIDLTVYDILGREVKVLQRGEKIAGDYTVAWDGTNVSGQPASNGIYFCRMVVGDFCQTQKLILKR